MNETQNQSDNDFEDEFVDNSPKAGIFQFFIIIIIEKNVSEEVNKGGRIEPINLPEKLVHVDQEIKAILYSKEPTGDYSLDPDFRLGYFYYGLKNYSWRPNTNFEGAPIPMRFDYEDNRNYYGIEDNLANVVYYGYRPQDSLAMHESFAKKAGYPFKFPTNSTYMLIDIARQCQNLKFKETRFSGMTNSFINNPHKFDSCFEGGNLDIALKVKENEYDLYMRTDSNTRGHHQWFYFSVTSKTATTIKFNILNFTKRDSLYLQGMRIAVFSEKKAEKANKGELPSLYKNWHRDGENITYKLSKLTQDLYQKAKIMYILNLCK